MAPFRSRPAARGVVVAADGSLVPLPYDPSQQQQQLALQKQQALAQAGAGQQVSQQLTGLAQQAAGAAGPEGAAIAAGLGAAQGIASAINQATTDKDGFAQTGTGATVARAAAESLTPLGLVSTAVSGFQHLSDPHMSTLEKVGAFVPGFSAFALRGSINRARDNYLAQKNKQATDAAVTQNQAANYRGLTYARRGGVLPRVPRFADGGTGPGSPAAPAPAPPTRYTVKNPSPEAQRYYQNVLPAMQGLIGQKHDEVYLDPVSGARCTANSCLSFANTVQEQALGTARADLSQPAQRTKQQSYNPEFTRTAEQQGWVPIPLAQARTGDRLQYWTRYEDENEAYARSQGQTLTPESRASMQQLTRERMADLGGRQLIADKYPYHMMVLASDMKAMDETRGTYWADIAQDGHEQAVADHKRKLNLTAGSYVAYRYIGVNGQPTNNPAAAVAVNPAAAGAAPGSPTPAAGAPASGGRPLSSVAPAAVRAQGGLVPRFRRGHFADGGTVSREAREAEEAAPAQTAPPKPGKPAAGGAAPLTEAFEQAEEAKYRAWVRALPAGHRQDIDPFTGNARDYDYRRAFREGVQADGNGHFTDRYKTPAHRTFSTESMYYNAGNRSQAGKWEPTPGGGNRWVPLDPKVKHAYVEDAKGRPVPGYAEGGELPASVIADGHLHSQKHGHAFRQDVTATGVPILQLHADEAEHGRQLAELEKDELTMSYELSQLVNGHVEKGEHEALGRLVAEQLLTNTKPSQRYAKRLAEGGTLPSDPDEDDDPVRSLVMLGADGKVQMRLRGEERIFSREHTRELVSRSLEAERPGHYRQLGRRVAQFVRQQNTRAARQAAAEAEAEA